MNTIIRSTRYLHPMKTTARTVALRAILSSSIASVLTALLGGLSTQAADATWNGTTSAIWSDDTNWSALAPGTGNIATFDNAGNGNVVLDLGAGITVNTLVFNTASAAAYTIGSGAVGSQTLTLNNGGAITMNSTVAASQLFNAALVLGTDGTAQTFTLTNASTTNLLTVAGGITGSTGAGLKTLAVAGAGNTTLSGIIGNGAGGGTVAISKTDAGILTLSNTNTYSGGTTVGVGSTVIASLAGALGAGAVTNNGTLNLTATTAGDITYTGLSTSMSGAGILNVSLLTGTSGRNLNGNFSAFNGTINIGVSTAAGGGKAVMNGLDHTDADVNVNTNATLYVAAAVTKNAELVLNGGDTGESLGQLRLESGAIWAGGVTLAGDLAAGDFTIGNNSGAGTISGIISETGSRALSKGGGGTITLSNANTYTGLTTVGGSGVLSITNADALGTTAAGTVVNSGASLEVAGGITTPTGESVTISGTGLTATPIGALRAGTGGGTWAGNVIIGSSADTRVGAIAGQTLTITGSIVNGAGTNIGVSGGSGTGKVIFNPTTNNNYAGSTSVFRGILELGKSNIIPDTSALSVGGSSVTDAATFSMAGFSETVFSLAHASTGAATIKVTNSGGAAVLTLDGAGGTGSTTFGGNIESTTPANLSLVKKGGTTQVLTGTNTFTGGVTVNGGTLGLNFTATIPAASPVSNILAPTNVLTIGNGSTGLTLTGKASTANAQTFASTTLNTGATTVTMTSNATANDLLLNLGAITRNAGATLNLTQTNITASATEGVVTSTANVNGILGGYATVGADWAVANGASGITAFTGYTVLPTSSAVGTTNYHLDSTGTTTLIASQSINSLKMAGTSTRTLALGANDLTINSGGITTVSTNISQTITGTTGGLVAANNELILHANSTGGSGLTISAIIKNNGANAVSVTKSGAQTAFLTGVNTFTGKMTLNAGTLSINSDSSLGVAPGVTTADHFVINGGTLNTTATMTLNANRGMTLNGATSLNIATGTTLTYDGIIAGAGALTKNSSTGTLLLTGSNTFTGNVNLNVGKLLIDNSNGLGLGTKIVTIVPSTNPTSLPGLQLDGSGGDISLPAGMSFTTSYVAVTNSVILPGEAAIRSLAGNNTVAGNFSLTTGGGGTALLVDAGTLTLSGSISSVSGGRAVNLRGDGSGVLSGVISNGSGTVGVVRDAGTGTWTLSGSNTYTGTTELYVGTLKLDYGTNNSSKLSDTVSALTLGGGTLELAGGSHTEAVFSTTLTAGRQSAVTRSSGTSILQMNTVTPGAGAVVTFGAGSIATTDNLNQNGILPWARIGTDWGKNDTNAADGLITAYSGYTDIDRLGGLVPNAIANNARIIEAGAAGNITLAGGALTQVNSLQMLATGGAATIAPTAGTDVFMVGDEAGGSIWQTSTAGPLNIGTVANDGVLTTGNVANAGAASLSLINDSATGALTIRSTISDNGTDIVSIGTSGAGKVVLTGTNTHTGATTVGSGSTLSLSSNANLGAVATGAALNLAASTLEITGTVDLFNGTPGTNNRAVNLSNSSTATINTTGANSLHIAGVVAGPGSILKTGTGSLTLAGVNTYGGSTTLDAGTLNINNAAALGVITDFSGTFTINGGTIDNTSLAPITTSNYPLVINSGFTFTGTQNLSLGAGATSLGTTAGTSRTLTVNGGILTLGGIVANGTTANALVKNGAGTLSLGGANTFTGGVTISGGAVTATVTNALGTGAVTNNGTLNLTAGAVNYTGISTSMSGAGIVNVTLGTGAGGTNLNGDYSTFNGTWNIGVGASAGAGKVQLNGADHTDAVIDVLQHGTLYVTTGTKNAEITLRGGDTGESLGQLRLEGGTWAGGVTLAGAITGSGDFTVGGNGSTGTISGIISETGGAQALSKGGSNTIILTNANTYTGGTTIGAGTLQIGNGTTGALSTTGGITNNGTLVFNRSNTITQGTDFGSAISGSGIVRQSGAGTLALTTGNTYTGGTTLASGVLNLAGAQSGSGGPLGGSGTVASVGIISFTGGTLQFSAANTTDYSSRFSEGSGMAYRLDTNGQNVIWGTGRTPAGTGTLTKLAAGTLNVTTVTNGWTGATTIEGGTLQVGGLAAINTNSSIGKGSVGGSAADLVLAGGTLRYAGTGATTTNRLFTIGNANGLTATLDSSAAAATDTLSFTGAGALGFGGSGARTLTLTGLNTGNNSLASTIGDGAGGVTTLEKSGVGKWILSGASGYSGATNVSGGTLIVSGSLSGTTSVSVAGGATLASGTTGSITTATAGNVAVTGNLAPGGSTLGADAGTLDLSLGTGGKLDFAATSTLLFGLGATSDLVAFNAPDDWLSGSGNATLQLDVTLAGFNYASTYTVFSNVTTGGFTFANITGYDSVNYTANFFDAGSSYQLSFVAVPEPGSLASLLGGLGMLIGLRRIRRRS